MVRGRAGGGLRNVGGVAVATANHGFGALLANEHFACGETFLEGEEGTGVLVVRTDDGEDGDILVIDGIEELPVALRASRGSSRGTRRCADKSQAAESADTEKSADAGSENRTL